MQTLHGTVIYSSILPTCLVAKFNIHLILLKIPEVFFIPDLLDLIGAPNNYSLIIGWNKIFTILAMISMQVAVMSPYHLSF